MRTRLTLKPGQSGTRNELRKYGGRLVAVRYRYDEARRMRVKTVELVEEEMPWVPRVPPDRDPHERVLVRIGYDEAELRVAAKNAGARWQQDRKLWEMSLGRAYALGLDQRIVR
jgi:hypothetical protein